MKQIPRSNLISGTGLFLLLFIGLAAGLHPALSYAQSPPSCSPALPKDICDAETRIYVDTDFTDTSQAQSAIESVKHLWISHLADSLPIREQILGLSDHVIEECHRVRAPADILKRAVGQPTLGSIKDAMDAYASLHGDIVPTGWKLPREIHFLVVDIDRDTQADKHHTDYRLGLFGWLTHAHSVEQLQITRYPSEVVIDKQAGIGGYSEGIFAQSEHGDPYFTMKTASSDDAPPEGLYLINLKVKDEPLVKGWFMLSGTSPVNSSSNASGDTPIVDSPLSGETLQGPSPQLRWQDFHSAEFRGFEQRKRMMSVYSESPGDSGNSKWSSAEIYPDVAETAVTSPLKNGAYSLRLSFEERWFFGGLLIGRQDGVEIPFNVAR